MLVGVPRVSGFTSLLLILLLMVVCFPKTQDGLQHECYNSSLHRTFPKDGTPMSCMQSETTKHVQLQDTCEKSTQNPGCPDSHHVLGMFSRIHHLPSRLSPLRSYTSSAKIAHQDTRHRDIATTKNRRHDERSPQPISTPNVPYSTQTQPQPKLTHHPRTHPSMPGLHTKDPGPQITSIQPRGNSPHHNSTVQVSIAGHRSPHATAQPSNDLPKSRQTD